MRDEIRFVVGADWHLNFYAQYPEMFGHLCDAFRETVALTRKLNADRLVLNGDTMDPRTGVTSNSLLDNVFDLFEEADHELDGTEAQIDDNLGNHGRGNIGTSDHSEVVFSSLKRVNVMREPTTVLLQARGFDCRMHYVPYCDGVDEFIAAVKGRRKAAMEPSLGRAGRVKNILFTHQWFRGQSVNQHEPAYDLGPDTCWSLPPTLFDAFDMNFNGHVHTHQVLNVAGCPSVTIGSPMQRNIGDRGQEKGVLVVTVTAGDVKVDRHIFTQFPRFRRIVLDKTTIEKYRKKDWSNTYLQIVRGDSSVTDADMAGFEAKALLPPEDAVAPVAEERLAGLAEDAPKEEVLKAANLALYPDLGQEQLDSLLKAEMLLVSKAEEAKRPEDQAVLPTSGRLGIEMLRFEGRNIGSYQAIDMDLSGHGVVVISGPNGVGKSNFIDDLRWTAYGDIDGLADEIVNDVAGKDCLGKLDFRFGKTPYTIQRPKKNRDVPKLELRREGKLTCGGDAEATKRRIQGILGLSLKAFDQLVCIQASMPFAGGTDKEKKELIEEVADSGEYQEPHRLAVTLIGEMAKQSAGFEEKRSSLDEQLTRADVHLTAMRSRKSGWGIKNSEDIRELKAQRRQLRERLEALAGEGQGDVESLKAAVAKARGALSAMPVPVPSDSAVSRAATAGEQLRGLDRQQEELTSQARKLKSQLYSLSKPGEWMADLIGKRCPTCRSKVTEQSAAACAAEEAARLTVKLEEKEGKLRQLEKDRIGADSALQKARASVTRLAEQRERYKALEKSLSEAERSLAAGLELSKTKDSRTGALEQRVKSATERIRELEGAANPFVDLEEKAGADVVKLTEQAEKVRAAAADLSGALAVTKRCAHVFGREGVRSLLIDRFMGTLNQKSADYIAQLSGGTIKFRFLGQRELQSKKKVEELTLEITVHGKPRSYRRCSSGQRRMIDFSAMLAMNDLLRARRLRSFNILLIDEVADPIDESNGERLAALLKRKAAESKMRIFLVTHKPALANLFSDRYTVKFVNGYSVLSRAP